MKYFLIIFTVILWHHFFPIADGVALSFTVDTHMDVLNGNCSEPKRCSLRQAFYHCLSGDHMDHDHDRNCSIILSPNALVYLHSPISMQFRSQPISLYGNGSIISPSNNQSSFGFLNIHGCFSFHLHNITISGFSGNHFESIIHIDNVINSSFHHVKFHNNIVAHKHAIVVKNSPYFTVSQSHFVDNVISHKVSNSYNIVYSGYEIAYVASVTYGGGFYIGAGNDNIYIKNCNVHHNTVTGYGAGIYSTGQTTNLFIWNNIFNNNIAVYGGAIYLMYSNTLIASTYIDGCNIFNNQAATSGYGGGIFVQKSNIFHMKNTVISGNTAGYAGGLYITGPNYDVIIDSCNFIKNTVNNNGGAIYIYQYVNNVQFINSNIAENTANFGGGLIMFNYNTNMTFTNCSISKNTATLSGGGLYVSSFNDKLSMYLCKIYGNRANIGGGLATYSPNKYLRIQQSLFYNNYAGYLGGAIHLEGSSNLISSTYIDGCNIYNNQAAAFIGFGGGIIVQKSNIFHMKNTIISGNSAGYAGGMYITGPNYDIIIDNCNFIRNAADNFGGGIYLHAENHNVQFINSNIAENTVRNAGGGLFISRYNTNMTFVNCSVFGNFARNDGGGLYFDRFNDGLTVYSCKIYDNSATMAAGMMIYYSNDHVLIQKSIIHNNIAFYDGGGVYIQISNRFFTIDASQIISNSAFYNGGGLMIFNENYLLAIINSNIQDNHVVTNGGGISVEGDNQRLSILSCNIAGNSASYGGGIRVSHSNTMMTIANSVFSNNLAKVDGGGLYYLITNTDSYVTNCTFYGNSAFNNGGAIFLNQSNNNLYMNHTVIRSNIARNSGGGIYVNTLNRNIVLYKCTLLYNKAGKTVSFGDISIEGSGDGGGVLLYFNNENFQIYYCTIYGNTATNKGGAVFLSAVNNNFYVTHTNISTNSALSGGGIALGTYNSYVTVTKCIFNANYAVDGGAIAVSNNNDNLMISDNIISNNIVSNKGGGLLVSSSYFITIVRSSFIRNFALKNIDGSGGGGLGGGICMDTCHDISISQTVFDGNRGGSQGGGLFLSDSNVFMNISHTIFLRNSAPNGGGMGLGNFNSNITISSSIFSNNTASALSISFGSSSTSGTGISSSSTSGGAIFIGLSNQLFTLIDCTMTYNKADNGGAMTFAGSSSDVVMENVYMTNNHGNVHGGALFIGQYSTGFVLHKVIFQSNSAVQNGGSLYMYDYINDIKLTKCSFRSSHSIQSDGGGVYINRYSNMISVLGCVFDNNIAYRNGGAIYVYQYNSHIDISDSIFSSNDVVVNGGGGGAIYFNDFNTFIHITRCSFLNNSVSGSFGSGGAISVSGSANYNISITRSLFSRNHAGDTGGALLLTSIHVVLLSELQFISNYVNGNRNGHGHGNGGAVTILMPTLVDPVSTATTTTSTTVDKKEVILRSCVYSNNSAGYGGAMSVTGGINVDITNNTFYGNIARDSSGSAIFLTATTGCTVRHNTFRNNHAKQIGSVYWTTKDMSEPIGLSDSDSGSKNIWQGNTALYGSRVATDLYRISSSKNITAYRYPVNNVLPSIHVIALDYYDQEMILLNMESISVKLSNNVMCKGLKPFFIGSITEMIYNGRVDFKSLIAYCAPNGYYDLIFSSSSLSLLNNGNSNSNSNSIGNVSSITRVYFPPCLKGDVTVASKCTCPVNAKECVGNDIILNPGVWRISKDAFTAQSCPYSPACMGKNLTGEMSCSIGYTGPYCNLCTTGYFMSSSAGKCEICKDNEAQSIIVAVLRSSIGNIFPVEYSQFSNSFSRHIIQSFPCKNIDPDGVTGGDIYIL
eukprot:gene7548-15465_t